MNHSHNTRVALALATLAISSGCLGPRRDQYVSRTAVDVGESTGPSDALWEAIQETLRRYRFPLDRVDRRTGVITTYAVTSQHLFEFWRHDVDTLPDLWESSWNPLRRWAEVNVGPADGGAGNALSVVVHKQRFSSPDRQFNSSGAAYQFFGYALPATTGEEHVTPADDRWLEIGRDPAMEEHLLRSIMHRAGMSVVDPGTPAPAGSPESP